MVVSWKNDVKIIWMQRRLLLLNCNTFIKLGSPIRFLFADHCPVQKLCTHPVFLIPHCQEAILVNCVENWHIRCICTSDFDSIATFTYLVHNQQLQIHKYRGCTTFRKQYLSCACPCIPFLFRQKICLTREICFFHENLASQMTLCVENSGFILTYLYIYSYF